MTTMISSSTADSQGSSTIPSLKSQMNNHHIRALSPLATVLTRGRRILWNGPPSILPGLLMPLRLYILDPYLAISSILLPPLLPTRLDAFLATIADHFLLTVLQLMYSTNKGSSTSESQSLRSTAKTILLHSPTVPQIHPPTDDQSAFEAGVSFVCSALIDILSVVSNPKKMQSWIQGMTQFQSYLQASGVGAELQEVCVQQYVLGSSRHCILGSFIGYIWIR